MSTQIDQKDSDFWGHLPLQLVDPLQTIWNTDPAQQAPILDRVSKLATSRAALPTSRQRPSGKGYDSDMARKDIDQALMSAVSFVLGTGVDPFPLLDHMLEIDR